MKKHLLILVALFVCALSFAMEPTAVIPLWPNGAPSDNGLSGPEIDNTTHVLNVTEPTLTVYLPEHPSSLAVIAIPGGSYYQVWINTEGHNLAEWYTSQGIVYAVLKYRLPNAHPEVPLEDVRRAIRIMRDSADRYSFTQLGVHGFSAGGHLAATAANFLLGTPEQLDFQILSYPVISMNQETTHMDSRINLLGTRPSRKQLKHYSLECRVTPQSPPAFLIASADDGLVPVANTELYHAALLKQGVPAQMHIFPTGGHGWTAAEWFPYRSEWMSELATWLQALIAK